MIKIFGLTILTKNEIKNYKDNYDDLLSELFNESLKKVNAEMSLIELLGKLKNQDELVRKEMIENFKEQYGKDK